MDVGAHAGQFTKLFSAMVPGGHVHAFEPGGYALSLLRRVVRLKRLTNVTVHPFGLGDVPGTRELHVPLKDSGSVGFGLSYIGEQETDARPAIAETVEIRSLDEVVRTHAIARTDFVKLDIEGYELRMLTGARETLERFQPAIFVEMVDGHLARCGDSARGLAEFLRDRGYDPVVGWEAFRPHGDQLFIGASFRGRA